MLTPSQIDDAWAIVGATPAGRNARQLLLNVLASLCPNPDNASALLRHEGRRTFARELLQKLDVEAQAQHGPDEPNTSANAPVSTRRPGSGLSRRVAPDPSVTDPAS